MRRWNILIFIASAVCFFACTTEDKVVFPIPANPILVLDAESVTVNGCASTLWPDDSGNGYNATLQGCTASGFLGTGSLADPYRLNFDGTNLRVTTGLDADKGAMPSATWIAWVRPSRINHGAEQQIISISDGASDHNRNLGIHANTNLFDAYDGSGTIWTTSTVAANVWQQVAVVYTNADVKFYKNGNEVSLGFAPTDTITTKNLSIGASNDGASERFAGDIAWVAVYDRALTQLEIIQTCNAIQGRFADTIYCE